MGSSQWLEATAGGGGKKVIQANELGNRDKDKGESKEGDSFV
jgi:hypothetical protein